MKLFILLSIEQDSNIPYTMHGVKQTLEDAKKLAQCVVRSMSRLRFISEDNITWYAKSNSGETFYIEMEEI